MQHPHKQVVAFIVEKLSWYFVFDTEIWDCLTLWQGNPLNNRQLVISWPYLFIWCPQLFKNLINNLNFLLSIKQRSHPAYFEKDAAYAPHVDGN